MIKVDEVLREVPHCETFCSVQKLHDFAESLRADSRFVVEIAGESVGGVPIYHVRYGVGSTKVLLVAGAHAMEPIASLTAFSLMTLLQRGNRHLVDVDVEWHIVPCIDPDGALLNEGWTQKPFTLESLMKNWYMQPSRDQVDISFPLSHKKLVFDQPSQEARVLKGVIDRVRPDLYLTGHCMNFGGVFYYVQHDMGEAWYRRLYELMRKQGLPIQSRPVWKEFCPQYSEAVLRNFSIEAFYDHMEKANSHPEELLKDCGAGSYDYLAKIKPEAQSFTTEMGYARHPSEESDADTGQPLRQIVLRVEADTKFLMASILEEWEKVKGDVDRRSPFFRVTDDNMAMARNRLVEGGQPVCLYPTGDLLFGPQYDKNATERDRFNAYMTDGGFLALCTNHAVVRLLKASEQTSAVRSATARLEQLFARAFEEIGRNIDFSKLEPIDCDTIGKAHLGSGLIALNYILERRAN